jgi:DNA (cytosine-5)-methyltransferase 1
MKYFSLFSGIGGFELGLQNDNLRPVQSNNSKRPNKQHDIKDKLGEWECVGYSEIDKYAIQIYEKHFNHKNYGDITKIKAEELPDFELLCGGFPCQSFSIAGKRMGFSDTRGTLFFEIARIAREKQPRLLLLENVKGLLSHDKGITFYTIISTLDELGYDLQWQVLNSKNFGVPQNRERVFIIGHLRGTSRPKVFPFGEDVQEDIESREVRTAATVSTRTGSTAGGQQFISQLNKPKHSNDRIYGADGLSPTLNTAQGGNRQPFVAPVLTPDRLNKRQNGRRMKEDGEPSFTLTSQDKHGVMLDSKIRRLTPTECERLQGFPDGWTEGVSDTQRYKTLGNAVTVNVIKEIARKVIHS